MKIHFLLIIYLNSVNVFTTDADTEKNIKFNKLKKVSEDLNETQVTEKTVVNNPS